MNVPLNIDFQQILLHLFNFAILGFGLYFLLYKPVKKFMDERTARYQAMKDEADACLERAKEQEALSAKRFEQLDEEMAEKRRLSLSETEAISARRVAEAEEQARKILLDARENALRERDALMVSAREEVSEMAIAAVKKLVSESVSESYDDFLDAAERSAVDEQL